MQKIQWIRKRLSLFQKRDIAPIKRHTGYNLLCENYQPNTRFTHLLNKHFTIIYQAESLVQLVQKPLPMIIIRFCSFSPFDNKSIK